MGDNFKLRVLSALVIGALFIISIIWPDPLFTLLMLWVAVGMLYEWYLITQTSKLDLLLGLVLVPQAITFLILTSYIDPSRLLLLYYFIIIWSVDTLAMIGGRAIRGPKLAPILSPNKTWSGFITGVLGAGLVTFITNLIPYTRLSNHYHITLPELIIGAILLASIAQCSDLLVSYFKRKFHVKDSGNIIPGHGGVLDRFDSIILTAWAPLLVAITCLK